MPFTAYDTREPDTRQSWDQDAGWNQVLACLPAELEARARQEKAFVRARCLPCAAALLRGLLAYVFGLCSFSQVGIWATISGLSRRGMGDRAWAKRMRQAQGWLWWLFTALLLSTQPQPPSRMGAGPILLVDATHLKEPGKRGKSWRIHLSYDLLAARMQEVCLSEQKAESLQLFTPIQGAIRVADRGYCKREPIATSIEAGEEVVVRLAWASLPLEHEDGSAVDIGAFFQGIDPRQQQVDEAVWISSSQGRMPLRLIAQRVNTQAAQRERGARKHAAQKQGQHLQPTTLLLCDWIVLVTSLPAASWPAEEVLLLYRARWQIELLFKRIKHLVQRHGLSSHQAKSNQAVIAVLLVGWALLEAQAGALKVSLTDEQDGVPLPVGEADSLASPLGPVSSWRVMATLVGSWRSMILGVWTWQQIHEAAKQLTGFLRSHPQDRVHAQSMLWAHFASSSLPCSVVQVLDA